MHNALAFDCMRALNIVMVGQKELLCSVKLTTTALGFFGTVVPTNPNFDVAAVISLEFLNACHVGSFVGIGGAEQNAIASCETDMI